MKRPAEDVITLHGPRGVFDKFSALEVSHDLYEGSSAWFEFGDEDSFGTMADPDNFLPGAKWEVRVNGLLQLRGRVEVLSGAGSLTDGGAMRVSLRTRLSDARFASAKTSTKVNNVSIADFVVELLGQVGIPKSEIKFDDFSRVTQLVTGARTRNGPKPVDLEPIQANQAKVQPGEPVHEAIMRHLERYGLLLIEDPSTGGVIVSRPATDAEPAYRFRSKRGNNYVTKGNNVLAFERVIDWTDVPREVVIYGQTWGADIEKSTLFGRAENPDVKRRGDETGEFMRRVVMVYNQIKNKDQAEARARRELSNMRRREDGWVITVDGATQYNGEGWVPFYFNNVATFDCDITGSRQGYSDKYLIHRVTVRGTPDQGITSRVEMTRADILNF